MSAAVCAKTAIMLPVAPGVPGNGPWQVEEWPDNGCTRCTIDQADLAALRTFLAELLQKGGENSPEVKLPVHVVRGGLDDGRSSFAELKKAVADCKLGSAGMLAPNSTTHIVAYAVRIDCAKTQHSSFMSVVIGNEHIPTAVYWLPDHPIIAVDPH